MKTKSITKLIAELVILGALVAWTINVLLAVFVPRGYFRNYLHVDNSPTLSHKVKSTFGMDLLDLEKSLALTPVVTGEEPFILTYSVPSRVEAATMGGYSPSNQLAQTRLLTLLDNGHDASACDISRQTNGIYLVKWNTVFASYGTHMLKIRLYFPWTGTHNVDGPKRDETITNIVQWEYDGFGFGRTRTWFHGWLHVPADYQIEIYDTNNILLKTIGAKNKKIISEIWDYKPTNGQPHSAEDFKARVYITPIITGTNGLIMSNAPTVRVIYP